MYVVRACTILGRLGYLFYKNIYAVENLNTYRNAGRQVVKYQVGIRTCARWIPTTGTPGWRGGETTGSLWEKKKNENTGRPEPSVVYCRERRGD